MHLLFNGIYSLIFMKNIKILYLLMLFAFFNCRQQQTSDPSDIASRPNVVLIISDDQGYNDLGVYGSKEIKTPNLDKLAAEGVRLTNFYMTGSGCTPSRSGLLTGRYPQRNGTFELFRNNMVNYGHQYTEYEYSTSPERILGTDLREVFISEALKPAGYVNGYFGKWDLGQLRRFLPLQQGFDDFYGFANTGIDYYTHERYGAPSMIDGNEPTTKDKGKYTTDLFKERAIEFLRRNADRANFLYLSFNAPHMASNLDPEVRGTVQAPEAYLQKYPEGVTRAEKRRRGYMAAVTAMDDAIGEVLQQIKDNRQEDNTIVIFMSDNGGSFSVADNAPLKGGKAQFFEGGIRVPCIIKWPGQIKPGTVNDDFLSSLEIFPTIIAAAGLELPDSIVYDGFNIIPVLQGKQESARKKMFWEFRGDYAGRVDNWKWVDSGKGKGLFNLSRDISEKNDLSKEHPEILSMMKTEFVKWQEEMANAEPRGPFKNF
jgi:arylsulfatase A-like enzyme